MDYIEKCDYYGSCNKFIYIPDCDQCVLCDNIIKECNIGLSHRKPYLENKCKCDDSICQDCAICCSNYPYCSAVTFCNCCDEDEAQIWYCEYCSI